MKNIDVCLNVYGKPWQTICTLKSLMKYCGNHIDKIYIVKEKEQPYNDKIDWISNYFDNLVFYTPKHYNFIKREFNFFDNDDILSLRYQYGISNTDKKHIFITHNDVLYSEDVIGNMLNLIGNSVGIGQIGQCWNCPLFDEGLCNGDKLESNFNKKISYDTVISIVDRYPNKRTNYQCKTWISKDNPFPMPECRLNEWACLLNVEMVRKENFPNGRVPFFGQYSGVDLGSGWFIEMFKKGYKFVNYQKGFDHGYWAGKSGHPVLTNINEYKNSEELAKKYYEENFI